MTAKKIYEIGEIPELGEIPEQMYAWVIREDRLGVPEQAMQIITNSIVKRNYNYKPWWTMVVKPLIFIFKRPFYKATIMNSK